MENNDIKELIIYENDENNIFNTSKSYRIPLYQRAYAWEDKQIIQLLEDINDSCENADNKYYIGTLVVADKGSYYEVVDGQQRLTTLFLLLQCLRTNIRHTLSFACRNKSNYTLENLDGILMNSSVIDNEKIQESIISGIRIIKGELSNRGKYGDDFLAKLAKVVMYRIVVPPHTDLNHYFETMNTRGEQLEQHDILKASLMSYLKEDNAWMSAFSEIWNACRDMSGYVQMNFSKPSREMLFGGYWDCIPTSLEHFVEAAKDRYTDTSNTLREIIAPDFKIRKSYSIADPSDKDANVRFESIIDFPHFLIHCLKTFASTNGLTSDDGKELCESLINDKKLNIFFGRVLKHGLHKGKSLDGKWFAEEFILHLLKMRFIFDTYIIKREFRGDCSVGEWSLQTLNVSGHGSNKKAYFTKTSFLKRGQRGKNNDYHHNGNLMIQAALRVSYTSPKVMHWITKMLLWLEKDENRNGLNSCCDFAEQIAQESIRENFFNNCEDDNYRLGVGTPHIVFNYLDYLIWNKNRKTYNEFTFEFRNSVEHWYPRHPSESEIKIWDDGGVDRFGNLCIIQRNINSKFSNLPPEGKKTSFRSMIDKGSLKLRLMSELTVPENGISANANWKDIVCGQHEKEMIDMLRRKCCPSEHP